MLMYDYTVILRIFAAVFLGFCLGLEREMTNKYAGLRTHILVCLGACIFTILSIDAFSQVGDNIHPQAFRDPARIAAQIVTGIGFIGAGTVMRHGSSVYGLTTAATLWVAASIGMACGAGAYDVAMIATLFSVVVLISVKIFEKNVLLTSTKNTKRLRINICCQNDNTEALHNYIITEYPHIYEISRKPSDKDLSLTKIVTVLDVSAKQPLQSMYQTFQGFVGVESISIQDADE